MIQKVILTSYHSLPKMPIKELIQSSWSSSFLTLPTTLWSGDNTWPIPGPMEQMSSLFDAERDAELLVFRFPDITYNPLIWWRHLANTYRTGQVYLMQSSWSSIFLSLEHSTNQNADATLLYSLLPLYRHFRDKGPVGATGKMALQRFVYKMYMTSPDDVFVLLSRLRHPRRVCMKSGIHLVWEPMKTS